MLRLPHASTTAEAGRSSALLHHPALWDLSFSHFSEYTHHGTLLHKRTINHHGIWISYLVFLSKPHSDEPIHLFDDTKSLIPSHNH